MSSVKLDTELLDEIIHRFCKKCKKRLVVDIKMFAQITKNAKKRNNNLLIERRHIGFDGWGNPSFEITVRPTKSMKRFKNYYLRLLKRFLQHEDFTCDHKISLHGCILGHFEYYNINNQRYKR